MDYALWAEMRALENIYHAVKHLRASPDERIHTLTDGERRILKMLLDMGLQLLD